MKQIFLSLAAILSLAGPNAFAAETPKPRPCTYYLEKFDEFDWRPLKVNGIFTATVPDTNDVFVAIVFENTLEEVWYTIRFPKKIKVKSAEGWNLPISGKTIAYCHPEN